MADVFISYRKADRPKAEALANALKVENLDVWWDVALETGETFDEKIQSVLEKCKAVIVIWSKESVKSDWVRAESSIGRERGILVPVMIQPVNIPVPFNLLHTADLIGWHGDRAHAGYQDVVKQVKELAGKSHVRPLKPPPNRALRALWRTVAIVAVIAVIGASVWVFRPWETLAPKDPVVEAKKDVEEKREASLNSLAPFGLALGDLDRHSSRYLAERIFRPETRAQLDIEAAKGDPVVLTLQCAVVLWTMVDDLPNYEAADPICEKASQAGEPVAHAFYGDVIMEASSYIFGSDDQRATLRSQAVTEYNKAADGGSAQGAISFGRELASGDNIAADPVRAEALFKAAKAKGLPEADYHLGMLYLGGEVAGPDYDTAFAMVRTAADAGVQEAQAYMADELSLSSEIPRLEAALAYRTACAKGVDHYVAFRCNESVAPLQKRIDDMKAAAPAP
jgi:hypothetical protein